MTRAARCWERSENWPFLRNLWRGQAGLARAVALSGTLGCTARPPQSWPARGRGVPTRPHSRTDQPGRQTSEQKRAGLLFFPRRSRARAPGDLPGPVCGLQMGNVNYRPRTGAPSTSKQLLLEGVSSLDAADRRSAPSVLRRLPGGRPPSQGPTRHLITDKIPTPSVTQRPVYSGEA